ncbi:MAG: noncanonical pyrimidine nucleotidase, YjjG family [Chloroflexi bacterium]|nr:noncanonical pyrimidine nucleotidase, YjjG family [Chloroflexota bacterium]
MRYNWILFDADGTLFDYERAEAIALQQAFRKRGLTFEPGYAEIYRRINRRAWRAYEKGEITKEMLRTSRFRQLFEEVDAATDSGRFSETYLQCLSEQSGTIEGAEEVVRSLHGTVGQVIITNGLKSVQRPRLANSAIGHYFADVVISDEVGSAKPARGIFDAAFERMGWPQKEEVLIVGDSLTADMKGGNAYGIDTCWFNPTRRPQNQDVTICYEINHLQELLSIVGVRSTFPK